MIKLILGGAAALAIAGPALADPVTRTYTFDTPRFEGSKTVTRDREEHMVARDTEVVRKSDGAVATREYDRDRNAGGIVASGSRSQFDGDSRSWNYEASRTARGYNAEGSLTRYNGSSYDYTAKVRRGENRVARSQVLRNDNGRVVAARRTVRPRRR